MLLYESAVRIRPAVVLFVRYYSKLPEEEALYITNRVAEGLEDNKHYTSEEIEKEIINVLKEGPKPFLAEKFKEIGYENLIRGITTT